MIRKYLYVVLLLMLCVGSQAQEKYFKAAFEAGRTLGSFYVVTNPKEKMIKKADLVEYCQEHNYLVGSTYIMNKSRLGGVTGTVRTFEFLPAEDYDQYVFENMTSNKYSVLRNAGSVFFFDPSEEDYFWPLDDAMWSAGVKNGKLHGQGIGYKKVTDRRYISFIGTFDEGIPQGDVLYNQFDVTGGYKAYTSQEWQKNMKTRNVSVGTMSENMAWFKYNGKYGYFNRQGKTVVKPIYANATNFSQGYAIVLEGDTKIKIDPNGTMFGIVGGSSMAYKDLLKIREKHSELSKAVEADVSVLLTKADFPLLLQIDQDFPTLKEKTLVRKNEIYAESCAQLDEIFKKTVADSEVKLANVSGRSFVASFIDDYENKYKFDPKGKLATAKLLTDYYVVCEAMAIKPLDSYWSDGRPPRIDDRGHIQKVRNGATICSEGMTTDFKSYYAFCKPQLDGKQKSISARMDNDAKHYDAAMSKYREKRDRALREVDQLGLSQVLGRISYRGEWSRGRLIDTWDNYTDHKSISFSDGIDLTIYECRRSYTNNGERYWYPETNTNNMCSSEMEATFMGYIHKKREQVERNYPLY